MLAAPSVLLQIGDLLVLLLGHLEDSSWKAVVSGVCLALSSQGVLSRPWSLQQIYNYLMAPGWLPESACKPAPTATAHQPLPIQTVEPAGRLCHFQPADWWTTLYGRCRLPQALSTPARACLKAMEGCLRRIPALTALPIAGRMPAPAATTLDLPPAVPLQPAVASWWQPAPSSA